ncbi:MAG: hypothetical protein Q9201_001640 [Fulgogasparrea decipioides]
MIGVKNSLVDFGRLLHRQKFSVYSARTGDTKGEAVRVERQAEKHQLREKLKLPLRRKKGLNGTTPSGLQKPPPSLLYLPFEIRLMIYEYAMGGNRFELVNHRVLLEKWLYNKTVDAGVKGVKPVDWNEPQHNLRPHSLSLALSCHQVYDEVIDLPYSCNTFVVKAPRAFINFATYSLQPQRLRAIRSLELTCHLESCYTVYPLMGVRKVHNEPYDPCDAGTWDECWMVIATRLQLSSLKVRFAVPLQDDILRDDLMEADGWIQPLLSVQNVRKLELVWTYVCESRYIAPESLRVLEKFERKVVATLQGNGNRVTSRIVDGGYL